jgi:hypothetical protein
MAKLDKKGYIAAIHKIDPEAVVEGRTVPQLKVMLELAEKDGNAHSESSHREPVHMCDNCTKDSDTCGSTSIEMDDTMTAVVECEDQAQPEADEADEENVSKASETVDAVNPQNIPKTPGNGGTIKVPVPSVIRNTVVRGNLAKGASIGGNVSNVPGHVNGKWATLGPVASVDFLKGEALVLHNGKVLTLTIA